MASERFDLVINGAGLAGAALALGAARAGHTVLLLERSRVFLDRVRGEYLSPWGVEEAQRLELAGVFEASGAHELPALMGRSGRPVVSKTPSGHVALTFAHQALQRELVGAAERAGATVRLGAQVGAVDRHSGAVSYRQDSHAMTIEAGLIAGAEGRSSITRRALDAPMRVHRSARMLSGVRLRRVGGDPSAGYFLLLEDAGGLACLFPQGDGYARAYLFMQGDDAATYRGAGGFRRFVDGLIDLGIPAAVLADAEQAGPLAAFVADDSWVTMPAQDRVFLIGDAAGISDPTWGQGMALALRDARTALAMMQRHGPTLEAARDYADRRVGYFDTIRVAENWLTELQLTPGVEALRRRRHALRLWSQEPDRALDLAGRGPDLDVSAAARVRVFGEDVPMAEPAVAG